MAVPQPAAALLPHVIDKGTCLFIPCRTFGLRNNFGCGKKVWGWERSLKLKVEVVQKCKCSGIEVITARLGTFKAFGKSEGRSLAALATAGLHLQCAEALISATAEEDMSCVRAGRNTSLFADSEPFLKSFSNVSVEDCLLNVETFRLRQLQEVKGSDMSTLLGNRYSITGSLGMLADSDTLTGRTGRQVDCHGNKAEEKLTNSVELGCGQGDPQDVAFREKRTTVVKSMRRKERQWKRRRMRKIGEKGSLVSSTASAERLKTPSSERSHKPSHLTTLRRESANPFTSYLLYIGKKDLLTAEDEVELAKQVQDLLKMEKEKCHLVARLGQEPTFREWSDALGMKLAVFQRRLWVARKAKFRMINSNLRLVVAIAKNYQGQGVPFQDLLQVFHLCTLGDKAVCHTSSCSPIQVSPGTYECSGGSVSSKPGKHELFGETWKACYRG